MKNLKVAIMGSGGREHALAWKLSYSSKVKRIYMIPGNGGTTQLTNTMNVEHIVTKEDLRNFLVGEQIDLVVIGPEQPLVDGLSDDLRKWGIACFGPSQKAALLEGSKAFSKCFMQTHSIPTAKFNVGYRGFSCFENAICMGIYRGGACVCGKED
jgi:phosphoribosylamine--glycine ligase / phosphoribosylformylglycinamidine cyclo-ligase